MLNLDNEVSMDPVTALTAATTAFNVIKKGFQIGRDVESMAGDLGRWAGALSTIREAEKEAKKPPPLFKKLLLKDNFQQQAIEIFAAKKKADQMEEELRNFISFHYGPSAWQGIVTTTARLRKEQQEAIAAQKKARKQFLENLGIAVAIIGLIGLCVGIAILMWPAVSAKMGL